MVEEEFMACRSSERAEKLKESPINLPAELQMSDRRDLDVAVFELIGVADRAEREGFVISFISKQETLSRDSDCRNKETENQRAKSEGRGFRIDELALDIWDALTDDERLSVPQWIETNFAQDWVVAIPDGNPKLPDAEDMLDAATVFFSSKKARVQRGSLVQLVRMQKSFINSASLASGEIFPCEFSRNLARRTIAATVEHRSTRRRIGAESIYR